MKTKTSLLLFTLATALGLSSPVVAKKLAQPEELSCSYARGMVLCNWNGTVAAATYETAASYDDATSYKWEITAEYDVDYNDGIADRKKKFHYETTEPSWSMSPSEMTASFNAEEDKNVVTRTPMSADVRVKAMYMEKDKDKGKGHAKGGKGKSSPYSGRAEVEFKSDCNIGMCR